MSGSKKERGRDIQAIKENEEEIPPTYVPFRNGIILSLAVAWAERIGSKTIFIGANEADSSGYPDCRKSFYNGFNDALKTGTKEGVEIITPLIDLSKEEIVELGNEIGVPFELTWSCYNSGKYPCGECESCILRAKGFEGTGLKDPLLKKT